MKHKQNGFWIRVWKDGDGRQGVVQAPNLPLGIWLACTILNKLWAHELFSVVGFGALFTWAYLEIRYGVSYFRRALGLLVFIITITNRLK